MIQHDTVMLSTIQYCHLLQGSIGKSRKGNLAWDTNLFLGGACRATPASSFDLQDEKLTVFAARTNQLALSRQTASKLLLKLYLSQNRTKRRPTN